MSMKKADGTIDKGDFIALHEIWPHLEHVVVPPTPPFHLITGAYTQGIAGTRDA